MFQIILCWLERMSSYNLKKNIINPINYGVLREIIYKANKY